MKSQISFFVSFLFLLIYFPVVVANDSHQFGGRISARAVVVNGLDSWLDALPGKLNYDDGFGVKLGQAQLFIDSRWHRNVSSHIRLQYHDNLGNRPDVTQAFISVKPIPSSEYGSRWRIGAFYPAWSVENREKGWHSPYTITNSAINSWIGEEVRAIGVEYQLKRSGRRANSQFDWSFSGALFNSNDTAGTLLGFRGWTFHDRQTGLFEELPLPPISPIVTGRFFRQDSNSDVFTEIDNKPGFYLNAELEKIGEWLIRYAYYDNQSNGQQLRVGQYTWDTRFHHFALRLRLSSETELLSQYMRGGTVMGISSVIDLEFDSFYLMLSKKINRWRLSLRAETFNSNELRIEADYFDFSERGDAITLAAFYQLNDQQKLGVEFFNVSSQRPARVTLGSPLNQKESSLMFNWEYRF